MSFTIVTVLHDSEEPLRGLLASLERHLPEPPQLVAVDAASTDGGPELAREHAAEVVSLGANPGFGAACNAGLELAREPVSVLLNPDCELLDGSLARLAACAATGPERLWAPRLLDPDGAIQRSAHALPGTPGGLISAFLHPPLLPRALRERCEPHRAERPRAVGWFIAACVVARTETLRRLGPFDPGQFLFYEDMDLCLRARAAGVPSVLDPGVALRHLGGHATRRAYAGEPHDLLARRRRSVVEANLGARAGELDDATQALTFATRALARAVLGRDGGRERAQLAGVRAARRSAA